MRCRDIAEAIFAVLKDGKMGEIYNAGVDEPVSMRRLVEIVCKQLGKDFDKCVDIGPYKHQKKVSKNSVVGKNFTGHALFLPYAVI